MLILQILEVAAKILLFSHYSKKTFTFFKKDFINKANVDIHALFSPCMVWHKSLYHSHQFQHQRCEDGCEDAVECQSEARKGPVVCAHFHGLACTHGMRCGAHG